MYQAMYSTSIPVIECWLWQDNVQINFFVQNTCTRDLLRSTNCISTLLPECERLFAQSCCLPVQMVLLRFMNINGSHMMNNTVQNIVCDYDSESYFYVFECEIEYGGQLHMLASGMHSTFTVWQVDCRHWEQQMAWSFANLRGLSNKMFEWIFLFYGRCWQKRT